MEKPPASIPTRQYSDPRERSSSSADQATEKESGQEPKEDDE